MKTRTWQIVRRARLAQWRRCRDCTRKLDRDGAVVVGDEMNVECPECDQIVPADDLCCGKCVAEEKEQTIKHTLCTVIDRIGGDAYNGMAHTVEELSRAFYETFLALEKRSVEIEREACAKVALTVGDGQRRFSIGEAIAAEIRARGEK